MQPTLPAYSLRALCNYLFAQGISKDLVLSRLNTTESDLDSADGTYLVTQFEDLLSFGGQHLNIPNIGFQHGRVFNISFWGILGYIVAASPNLAQALKYQQRYQCLLGNSGLAYHDISDDVVTMRWLSEVGASPNSVEQVITAWAAFAFIHTQSTEQPLSVHFTHEPLVDDLSEYQDFFRCPVFFNAEFNGIKVTPKNFTLPICTSNAQVLNVLCSHAEHSLLAKQRTTPLDIIRQFIVETLPNKVPELGDIANHLGMSERQVQRLLRKYNTNLTQFLDRTRLTLALAYLTQSDHGLLYISQVLGYSEQSAFQRAFKRRYQVTPREYRLKPFTPILSTPDH